MSDYHDWVKLGKTAQKTNRHQHPTFQVHVLRRAPQPLKRLLPNSASHRQEAEDAASLVINKHHSQWRRHLPSAQQ
jgi:hypothetical protein